MLSDLPQITDLVSGELGLGTEDLRPRSLFFMLLPSLTILAIVTGGLEKSGSDSGQA